MLICQYMKPDLVSRLGSILAEFQKSLDGIKVKQSELLKRIRKAIDVGKANKIRRDLGIPE